MQPQPATLLAAVLLCVPAAAAGEREDRALLVRAVQQAFQGTHEGFSVDEVIVRDDLNGAFLARCRKSVPHADDYQLNWTLLNLRKAGKLTGRATKRVTLRHDDYRHAAEIAARLMYDRHQQTIDRVLCNPRYRRQFDSLAQSIAPDVSAYRLRKAALSLRKARQLRPELVVRVADWKKQVLTLSASHVREKPDLVPAVPGIYVFRAAGGYLYVGESADLRHRVAGHLDQSDRQSLARYFRDRGIDGVTVELHAFDPASNARLVAMRRAYESELIASRRPRLNVRP
jgi:hypothetical protein